MKAKLLLFLFIVLISVSVVSATPPSVGYIYYNSEKIDSNLVSHMQNQGFNVELLRSTNVPTTDLSQYVFLLINNEHL